MAFTVQATGSRINTDEIIRGTLIWAKYSTWDSGIAGVVSDVSAERVKVHFFPVSQNVENHFYITAEEYSGGLWELRYSTDGLKTITEYKPETEEATDGS